MECWSIGNRGRVFLSPNTPLLHHSTYIDAIFSLLDLRAEELRKLNWIAFGGGFLVAFSLLVQILAVIGSTRMAKQTFPPLASPQTDDVRSVGLVLFGNYNLPFQAIAVLILVATIGVMVLSKRQLR